MPDASGAFLTPGDFPPIIRSEPSKGTFMIRRQDRSVLLLHHLGYSFVRNAFYRLKRAPITRIVVFHDILPEARANFRANLDFLKQSTHVISLDDFFAGRLSLKKINVAITFDDGYKSWTTEATPVLIELGLPATFFISSGFVGLAPDQEAAFIRERLFLTLGVRKISGGLALDDLKTIAREGFAIGGHTRHHADLSRFEESVSLEREIAEDKQWLEHVVGTAPAYFAYPFGASEAPGVDLSGILKRLGYKAAVTTESGINSGTTNPYRLYREQTSAKMSNAVFKARVLGSYDGVRFIRRALRKLIGADPLDCRRPDAFFRKRGPAR